MFKLVYNLGCLPRDWKLANVVPVHKRGSKANIEISGLVLLLI